MLKSAWREKVALSRLQDDEILAELSSRVLTATRLTPEEVVALAYYYDWAGSGEYDDVFD
ncbi:hypothetical protein PR001_g10688 [Phytophthora rubi]|uniref:Uncharacterized protein n=1 Tax=Phytophthora rubi TaxID=129364 RepID=A0A6A3MSR4_9STRA|nr:hypothetical protein PR001_g10688 [Phytophthora rubi]